MSDINNAYDNKFLFTGLNIKNHDINNANQKILNRNIAIFGKSPCYQQRNINIDSTLKNINKSSNNFRPETNKTCNDNN